MPECELCGIIHAAVNEAQWVNQELLICPDCWRDLEIRAGYADE